MKIEIRNENHISYPDTVVGRLQMFKNSIVQLLNGLAISVQ